MSSRNGLDDGPTFRVTRAQPPLTREQLVRVARHDFWNRELPQRFMDAGQRLEPFTDHADVGMSGETD